MIRSVALVVAGAVLFVASLVLAIWLHADLGGGKVLSLFGMLDDIRGQLSIGAALVGIVFVWIGSMAILRRRAVEREERINELLHRQPR